MPKIPTYTGTDSDDPERPEIEHFGNCSVCVAFNLRDLAQVMAHMHGVEPLDLAELPEPEEQ